MSPSQNTRLEHPVDERRDHMLGPGSAPITLVEYGSYACRFCRAANERVATLRDQFGNRLRYVFRHRPIPGREYALRAAELAEQAQTDEQFWRVHVALMERGEELSQEDIDRAARELGLGELDPEERAALAERARARVAADTQSAYASGVLLTPTFFINGRRYDGAWDAVSLEDALEGSLGYRMRAAALDFARWAPSAGVLLALASLVAVIVSNSALGEAFENIWREPWGLTAHGGRFEMPLRDWVNDGLLTIFFLVVGLEIKREFTVGRLATWKTAALPIAAAIGGLVTPAVLYILLIPSGPWAHGWGVPMSTDTAFAIALIALLGRRAPIELRIFLTAAAIVDDIGAILVVAAFYSGELNFGWLAAAAVVVAALASLNRMHVYRPSPYLLLGLLLWICVHAAGLHATLAGVLLAVFIPTLPPPNFNALMAQANAVFVAEARRNEEVLRHGPSAPTLEAIDAIFDRLESPADRLLRRAAPRSSYLVLPVFALANAGVEMSADALQGRAPLITALMVALVVGKPLGLTLASLLAVRLGWAVKPPEYSWRQLAGAGALAGIGFTMSLFIASEAFTNASDFAAAKVAIFTASAVSALIGVLILWNAQESRARSKADASLETATDRGRV